MGMVAWACHPNWGLQIPEAQWPSRLATGKPQTSERLHIT